MTARPAPHGTTGALRRRFLLLLGLGVLVVLVGQVSMSLGIWSQSPRAERARVELMKEKLVWAHARLDPLAPSERPEELRVLRPLLEMHLELADAGTPPRGAIARPLSDGQILIADRPPRLPRLLWLIPPLLPTLALCAVLLWLGLPLFHDLSRLEEVAGAMAAGELEARARLTGPAKDVGDAFDGMADAVATMLRNQKHLLHAVSHEIRTPLARMRFRLESLPDEVDTTALQSEIDAVDALLSELLHYQRLGQAPSEDPMDPESVHDLVQRTVDKMAVLSHIATEVEIRGPVRMGPRDFTRVLENLISNAQRHARSVIRVTVGPDLVVEDDGPGVPPDIRPTIFEPFATGDPSRSKELGGVGLGLALVKRTAERWGGDVLLDDGALGGARFRIVVG